MQYFRNKLTKIKYHARIIAYFKEGITKWSNEINNKLTRTGQHNKYLNKDRPTDVTCFIISLFTAQHVSNVSTSIFRSLRFILDLFHVLYCSGSMCEAKLQPV